MSWESKFISLCDHISSWSKDTSTKVGAVITNRRNKILSIGYNGLPIGVNDDPDIYPDRHQRPEKYQWYSHAEENAIASAAEMGVSLKGAKIYCNYLPCCNCARMIIQSGITEVVFQHADVNSAKNSESWQKSKEVTIKMFNESKVIVRQYQQNSLI